MLDGRVGVTPLDVEIARWLRRQLARSGTLEHCCDVTIRVALGGCECRQHLRVIPVANKCEANSTALEFVSEMSADFDALGFGEVCNDGDCGYYAPYAVRSTLGTTRPMP